MCIQVLHLFQGSIIFSFSLDITVYWNPTPIQKMENICKEKILHKSVLIEAIWIFQIPSTWSHCENHVHLLQSSLVCFTLFSILHGHKMVLHSKKHSSQDIPRKGGRRWSWEKGSFHSFYLGVLPLTAPFWCNTSCAFNVLIPPILLPPVDPHTL